MKFTGSKSHVVTGASRGIGAEIFKTLASFGIKKFGLTIEVQKLLKLLKQKLKPLVVKLQLLSRCNK